MGTIADKLNKALANKADIKAALIEKNRTPNDNMSTYGDEIRAIEAGGGEFSSFTKDYIEWDSNDFTYDFMDGDEGPAMLIIMEGISLNYGDIITLELNTEMFSFAQTMVVPDRQVGEWAMMINDPINELLFVFIVGDEEVTAGYALDWNTFEPVEQSVLEEHINRIIITALKQP